MNGFKGALGSTAGKDMLAEMEKKAAELIAAAEGDELYAGEFRELLQDTACSLMLWCGALNRLSAELGKSISDGLRYARSGDKIYEIIQDDVTDEIYIEGFEIEDVSEKALYYADGWSEFEELEGMNTVFVSREAAEKYKAELTKKS